jgi:hypothetical protein
LGLYGGISTCTHVKEPDIDSSLRKFGHPNASPGLSEGCSIAGCIRILDNTPSVAVLAVVAVSISLSAGLRHALRLGAPGSSVERHLITGGKVDPLKDVDLATCDGRIRNTVSVLRQHKPAGQFTPAPRLQYAPHALYSILILFLEDV